MPEMEKSRAPENKRSRKPAHPVKRDVNQEMKNFAENTMNELLGWYGYDNMDLQDSDTSDNRNRAKRNHISVLKENSMPKSHAVERKVPSSSSEPVRNGERESAVTPLSPSSSSYSSSVSPRLKDQHSMNVIVPLIKPSAVEDVQNVEIVCVWCQKEGMKRYSLLMGSELKSFCSEKCFAACRRAYFKRNKARDEDRHGDQSPPPGQTLDTPSRLLLKMNSSTRVCDWCKHVRHTKEYLDFGSGDEKVQFCSTKCLNQYKMDVFYREARAALTGSGSGSAPKDEENHPKASIRENQKLLTPESWDSPPPETQTLTPAPTSALNTASSSSSTSSSSLRSPTTTAQSRERERSSQQVQSTPLSPTSTSHVTVTQPRPPQNTLPFIRPPLHAQGLRSPLPHPPRNPGRPASPTQRPPHAPPFSPLHPPPLMQPYPAPYLPLHPSYPPPLPPPWPQPMLLLPYPVILPVPIPIPIPIPVPTLPGQTGVIRRLQEEKDTCDSAPDLGHGGSEDTDEGPCLHRVKTERTSSPLSSPLSSSSLGSAERQVIQRLHRQPVKQESRDITHNTHPTNIPQTHTHTPDPPTDVQTATHTTHISHVLRKALKHHAANTTSVVTPTPSTSLDNKTLTPASLYSLARSTAIQVASVSLDGSHKSVPTSDLKAGSAQIPSPLSDAEDVKENSYLGRRENRSSELWSEEQTDCQTDQSKDSREAEDGPQDEEHTYARSIPPKLREKNAHTNAQTTALTHIHTQTQRWEKNSHTLPQGPEQSSREEPEPAGKRRCLRIRDQNK